MVVVLDWVEKGVLDWVVEKGVLDWVVGKGVLDWDGNG